MSTKQYQPWHHNQPMLLPPDLRSWLPEDHLVWFIIDIVEHLDLSELHRAHQEKDPRGQQPYDPRMMVALLLYAYAVGVYSSRRIERATHEDVAFRVLTAGHHPDHSTISGFRRDHLEQIQIWFLEVLRLAHGMGLVSFGLLGLDGTKLKANASKHKAMSYDRMKTEIARLEREIAALLERAEEVDQEEDQRYGDGAMGDLPAELQRREDRLAKIREAKAALEAEAAAVRVAELREQQARHVERAEDPELSEKARRLAATLAEQRREQAEALDDHVDDDDDDAGGSPLPSHKVKHTGEGQPKDKEQRNFTDPESRIMTEDGGHFIQGYNGQIVVDDENQMIVAHGVSNLGTDAPYFEPMLERTRSAVEALGLDLTDITLVADAGYWSVANARAAPQLGFDALISVRRIRHGTSPPTLTDLPADHPRTQMLAKLQTEEGQMAYRRRKVLPEPVFGQIKGCRGFRTLLLRGLQKVRGEWALVALTHNLLKMWRSGRPLAA